MLPVANIKVMLNKLTILISISWNDCLVGDEVLLLVSIVQREWELGMLWVTLLSLHTCIQGNFFFFLCKFSKIQLWKLSQPMNVLYIVALPAPGPFLIVPWNFTEGLNQAGCHPTHLLRVWHAKEHKTSSCPATSLSVSDKEQKKSPLNWHQDPRSMLACQLMSRRKGPKHFLCTAWIIFISGMQEEARCVEFTSTSETTKLIYSLNQWISIYWLDPMWNAWRHGPWLPVVFSLAWDTGNKQVSEHINNDNLGKKKQKKLPRRMWSQNG